MRKLTFATAVALTGAALALPGGASAAGTADASVTPCTPLVPCLLNTVRELTTCPPGGCVPPPCRLIWGEDYC